MRILWGPTIAVLRNWAKTLFLAFRNFPFPKQKKKEKKKKVHPFCVKLSPLKGEKPTAEYLLLYNSFYGNSSWNKAGQMNYHI